MRLISITVFLLFLNFASASADGMATQDEFYSAIFAVKSPVTLNAPYGEIEVINGDYALLPDGGGSYHHIVFIGEAKLKLLALPANDTLNLFYEMGLFNLGDPVEIDISGFYAKCGPDSGLEPFGEGIPMLVDKDAPSEFAQQLWGFYVQAWSDALPAELTHEEMMAAMRGGGMRGPQVREPKDAEFFIALFTNDGKRFDYTRDAKGAIEITDYLEGFAYFVHPYFVNAENYDPSIDFTQKDVVYTFNPETQETSVSILLKGKVQRSLDGYRAYCYPWLTVTYVEVDGQSVPFKRKKVAGEASWAVDILHKFAAKKAVQLYVELSGIAPKSYDAIGYGGVYRFDDYALYTGSDACDKIVYAEMPEGSNWNFTISPGGESLHEDDYTRSAKWENYGRGVMLVATQFPLREVKSGGVTLKVYAPEDIIGHVETNPSVAQLGDMLDYYSERFGVFSHIYPEGRIDEQSVFLIPDEEGVAAFENAGLLFYLGSQTNLPLVAHEASHIWWGQMVDGPTWFVEGMANYCPITYFDEFEPATAESYRRYIMQAAVAQGKPMSLDRRMELGDKAALYQSGAGLFVMLEYIYGKDAFHSALKAICEKHTDKEELSTDAIFSQLGKELKTNLSDFKRTFFDSTAAPLFSAGIRPTIKNNHLLTVRRAPGLKGSLPVDVKISTADGNSRIVRVETRGETTEMQLALRGELGTIVLDPDNKMLINTPERITYAKFLGWLMPGWMKRGTGDFAGAIYCMEQALKYRRWARDYRDLADLYFSAGRIDEARTMTTELLEAVEAGRDFGGHEIEADTLCKIHWLAGRLAETDGDKERAKFHFEKVIELGSETGLFNLVRGAQEKLGIKTEDSTSGSMPKMGMGG